MLWDKVKSLPINKIRFLNWVAKNLVSNYECWQCSKGGIKVLIIRKKGLIPRLRQSSCNTYNTHSTFHNKTKIFLDGQFSQPLKSQSRQRYSGNSQNLLNNHYKRLPKCSFNSKFFLYTKRTVGFNHKYLQNNPLLTLV